MTNSPVCRLSSEEQKEEEAIHHMLVCTLTGQSLLVKNTPAIQLGFLLDLLQLNLAFQKRLKSFTEYITFLAVQVAEHLTLTHAYRIALQTSAQHLTKVTSHSTQTAEIHLGQKAHQAEPSNRP